MSTIDILISLFLYFGLTHCQFPIEKHANHIIKFRAGFSTRTTTISARKQNDLCVNDQTFDELIVSGFDCVDGIYTRSDIDINGRAHFERISKNSSVPTVHLYWYNNKWIFHYNTNPSHDNNRLLAYTISDTETPLDNLCLWNIRQGKTYSLVPSFRIRKLCSKAIVSSDESVISTVEIMGVPKVLWPIFAAFMLDAIAVGLVMPLLPFYVMELNANALGLSMVVSANYIAQMIGCVFMGRVSDLYGRRLVTTFCLSASAISYFCVSHATTLSQVALARVIVGSCGGLVPVIQSTVSDIIPLADRPKYLGRIQAAFGLGFVLGPMISALLPTMPTKYKIRLSAILPFLGLLLCFSFLDETKAGLRGSSTTTSCNVSPEIQILGVAARLSKDSLKTENEHVQQNNELTVSKADAIALPVASLVFCGFLLMYAFGTETIYAVLLKDVFGYGEKALSTILAINGLFIGLFQVFLIKHLVQRLGKHVTLSLGNAMLAIGMLGIGLCRNKVLHFIAFTVHIIGYSIADTGVASLISRYASASSQGRDLALNQAAQACARVFSPMIAGLLYQKSLHAKFFPIGALPYILGALFPAVGVTVPLFLLYLKKKNMSKNILNQ